MSATADPHAAGAIETAGAPLSEANAAVVMLHGRGARAAGMLQFAEEFDADGVTYLAPQAARNTWYPNSFLAPIDDNEPHLASALRTVERTIERATDAGVPAERVVVLGFSQGACLASEFVARNARRYGGLVALSGGLIGPEGTPRDYDGDLDGTPVFLGCGDADPHIPKSRVDETERALADLGADVTKVIYEGMGHGIVADELDYVAEIIDGVATAGGDR